MMNKGQAVVISGPSGSGKDTVISKVLEKLGDRGFLSVSMTTRAARGNETDGVDYYFVDTETFEKNIKDDLMLEYAKYGENYYGTPAAPVRRLLEEGKTVFLNIEVQGGASVRRLMPQAKEIFLIPPSIAELEARLRKRGTETDEAIKKRLAIAEQEMLRAVEYDYIVINDELETAVNDVLSIIRAEELRTINMKKTISEVITNA